MTTDMIGSAEAAELLGWSRTRVKIAAQAGQLPIAGKLPGETGAYLFHRSVIEHLAATEAAS